MSSVLKWCSTFVAAALSWQAQGAVITPVEYHGGTALLVTGDIQSGDGAKFRSEISKYDNGYVILESQGGSLSDALDIGATIHLKGWPTAVLNGSECNSACALIWLAGTPRALSKSARIGFHAAYSDTSGSAQESGVGNAVVGRYLTLLNLPEKAVIFATTSPPSRLSWLTASNFGSTGIDVKVIDDVDLTSDQPKSENSSAPTIQTVTTAPPPPLIQTVTAPPAAAPKSDTSVWKSVGPGSVYVDHTLQDGCFLLAEFHDETIFRVGVDRELKNQYYILLANPGWRSLQAGQKYDVQFQFGTNTPWNVPTTAKDMGRSTVLMSNFVDPAFWNEFSNSEDLNVTRNGKSVTKLVLDGSKAAFDELVKCQRYEDAQARSRDPFAQ